MRQGDRNVRWTTGEPALGITRLMPFCAADLEVYDSKVSAELAS